jgi:hypothetical protein
VIQWRSLLVVTPLALDLGGCRRSSVRDSRANRGPRRYRVDGWNDDARLLGSTRIAPSFLEANRLSVSFHLCQMQTEAPRKSMPRSC